MFGPICTGTFLFISLWGTVFLSILGGLYYNQSVGLFEDLPAEDKGAVEHQTWPERVKNINKLYSQNAYNAWIAAGVYAGLALLLTFRACCLIRQK
ncbi:unnamed protein product [Auanema sp. JU1783]|nr:unnamed protein product [Auanema sp. JU1783]